MEESVFLRAKPLLPPEAAKAPKLLTEAAKAPKLLLTPEAAKAPQLLMLKLLQQKRTLQNLLNLPHIYL